MRTSTAKTKKSARNSHVFTISFPPELARNVKATAKAENRNISELFREAFRAYNFTKMRERLDAINKEASKRVAGNYTEADVEDLVDEIRSRNFRNRKRIA